MLIDWRGAAFMRFVDGQLEKKAHNCGQRMVSVAKSFAAVDTGFMRANVYYTYAPATKTLSLHSDAPYTMPQEFGWHSHPGHPFLRPAMLIAGPGFFTGINTNIAVGTSLGVNHVPRTIAAHIRPHISAANRKYNRGVVKRTALTAFHVTRSGQTVRHTAPTGQRFAMKSSLSKLNRISKAWN